MSEEEIIEKIEDYIELLSVDEIPLEIPAIFQKEWAETLKGLLDLYKQEKEKNIKLKQEMTKKNWVKIKENGEIVPLFYISKDKIRDLVKTIKDRPVKDNMFISATQAKLNTIIELEGLLEE